MKKHLIIIPAYNEADNIERIVSDIKENAPSFDYVIINDCSTDSTLDILRKNSFSYLNLPVNLGIGGAVQTGYRYAFYHDYETAVQFDGDGQHDAKYLEVLLSYMTTGSYDMIIGSRFIEKEGFQSSRLRRFGIRYFTGLIRLLTKTTITDPTSGFRIVNRNIMKKFTFDYPKDYPEPETVVSVLVDGGKIKEIPVIMHKRQGGTSSISIKNGAYYMIKVSFAMILARIKR